MSLRLSLLSGLAVLAVVPAFPNIIDNITVNGTVSAEGSILVPCNVGSPGCEPTSIGGRLTIPFGFSDTNNTLGMFSDSGNTPSGPPSLTATVGENTGMLPTSRGSPTLSLPRYRVDIP